MGSPNHLVPTGKWLVLFLVAGVTATTLVVSFSALNSTLLPLIIEPKISALTKQNILESNRVISAYEATGVSTSFTPWMLFHGILGHGGDFVIDDRSGEDRKGQISCEDWLLHRAASHPLFSGTPLVVERQWGVSFVRSPIITNQMQFEDHYCQFLFILMESGANLDATFVLVPPNGRRCALREMLAGEEQFCNGTLDVSWAMPVFAKWGDKSWTNKFGEQFDLDRLMNQHLELEKHCTACFGTHWRMGLALTLRYAGDQLSKDVQRRAQNRLQQLVKEARTQQDLNSGRFVLEDAASAVGIHDIEQLTNDRSAVLSHQGHTLEWLMVGLSDKQLATEVWPHLAVKFLIEKLQDRNDSLNYGAYAHCIDAVRFYRRRMETLEVQASKGAL